MSLLTINQASRRLPFSEPSLRDRIKRGDLTVTRISGRIYLDEAQLAEKFGQLFRSA
jgi:hypothetical protein